MTRSPEAVRFLELLLLEFIMASVLGLFYTLLNGGSYSPPPSITHEENTPTTVRFDPNTAHKHTHTQKRFIFSLMHLQ